MRNAVGFYWTLPVPWADFDRLPEDTDGAAKASRTIRYQRELIRRHAKEQKYRLAEEKVFLELAPDRGSEHVLDALRPVAVICRELDAVLLLVDFSAVRGGAVMVHYRNGADNLRFTPSLYTRTRFPSMVRHSIPTATSLNGADFRMNGQTAKRIALRMRRMSLESCELKKKTYKSIAESLNNACIRSATGKDWTSDNVRALLK